MITKKWLLAGALALSLGSGTLWPAAAAMAAETPLVAVEHEGIQHSESVYPYKGGLFISNVGPQMRPEAGKKDGYIFYQKDGQQQLIVKPGILHSPTAMLVKGHSLFVCDGPVLYVFDLQHPEQMPQQITFASDDKVVNDIAADGNTLYITLTNTGRIYTLDISDPANMAKVKPKLWLTLPGPNGIVIGGDDLYIASIPVDYATVRPENIIYRIRHFREDPVVEKFVNIPGLYDGVALSDDGQTLYISDWRTASVTAVDTHTKKTQVLYQEKGIGPADIAQTGGRLYIPDIVNSRLISLQVK